jgi:signal transduction histidine kinase
MDRLVSDLLDVSRIEAGRIRLDIEDVQLKEVINDVLQSLRNQIEQKNLRLTLNLAEDLPEIRADYGRMMQIVTNLISNAYKYTPAEGSITVTAQPHNGEIDAAK